MIALPWQRGRWRIDRGTNGAGNPCLKVYGTTLRTAWIDYPIQWPDGQIAYDHPQVIPKRVKAAVASLMPMLKEG